MQSSFVLLAQVPLPDTTALESGDARAILVWIIVGLLTTLIAVVGFFMRREGIHRGELKEVSDKAATDQAEIVGRWSEAKLGWEAKQREIVERERDAAKLYAVSQAERDDRHANEKERLFREMLELAQRLEGVVSSALKRGG